MNSDDDHEDGQAEVGEGAVGAGEARSVEGEPEALVHEARQGEDEVLHQQPEGQRDQGDIEVAEPDAEKADDEPDAPGDQTPGHHGGQHRPAVVVGQLRRGERADAGEGDLAQPEHAALSGDEGPGQEDDAEGERLGRPDPPRIPGR